MLLVLLIKVTLLFCLAMLSGPLLRRSTAALRHLIYAMALSGSVLFPFTLILTRQVIPIRLPVVFVSAASDASAASQEFPFSTVLLALWAAGTLALLARLTLGYRRISQVRQTARPTVDNPRVFVADVSAPLICGLFHTTILMPRSSASWPPSQRTAAICHELAHMRRKDLFTSLIARIACAVYWFHPLVWAVARRLHEEQEAACDDAVLSTGFEPATYAEALVATAQQLTSTSLIGCHMLTSQTLKSRIARLLDVSLPRTSSTAAIIRTVVMSVATLAAIGLMYADPPQSPSRTPANEKIYRTNEGITPPAVVSKVEPRYTEEARAAKIEGSVVLSVVVGSDGVPHDINVISAPDSGLGVKAAEAVQQWKFLPGTKDGEAVSVKATIEVNFKLI